MVLEEFEWSEWGERHKRESRRLSDEASAGTATFINNGGTIASREEDISLQ
jgi:hypothetical protein